MPAWPVPERQRAVRRRRIALSRSRERHSPDERRLASPAPPVSPRSRSVRATPTATGSTAAATARSTRPSTASRSPPALPPRDPGLHRAQTRRRQEHQGSHALPQAPPHPTRLAPPATACARPGSDAHTPNLLTRSSGSRSAEDPRFAIACVEGTSAELAKPRLGVPRTGRADLSVEVVREVGGRLSQRRVGGGDVAESVEQREVVDGAAVADVGDVDAGFVEQAGVRLAFVA